MIGKPLQLNFLIQPEKVAVDLRANGYELELIPATRQAERALEVVHQLCLHGSVQRAVGRAE